MKRAVGLACAAAAGVGLAACLLADPGPTLPQPQDLPPFIKGLDVQPPQGQVLTSLPVSFVVPVVQIDTTKSYFWRLFIDYDPLAGSSFTTGGSGTSAEPNITFTVAATDITGEGCHSIQVVVSDGWEGDQDRSAHTPIPPGGAGVTWFYSPGGDLAGCPTFTGEVDASFPDAGSDAGEAGTE